MTLRPPRDAIPHEELQELLAAAATAARAESDLVASREAYAKTHDAVTLARVDRDSREALKRELEFSAIWQKMSKHWFEDQS